MELIDREKEAQVAETFAKSVERSMAKANVTILTNVRRHVENMMPRQGINTYEDLVSRKDVLRVIQEHIDEFLKYV